MKADVHQQITRTIIDAIEAGETTTALPWRQQCTRPIKLSDGTPYRGVNTLHLWAVAALRGFTSPLWGGYKGWKRLGGYVRRHEKATVVVYASVRQVEDSATGEVRTVPFARSFKVFNRDQIDGLAEEPVVLTLDPLAPTEAADRMDALAGRVGAEVRRLGDEAFYDLRTDSITVPPRCEFVGTATQDADVGYASTLGHELIHWSGAERRLDRSLGRRGTDSYAQEELIAELGAAYLCHDLGIAYTGVADHAGYLAHWLEIMGRDTRALFTASAAASKASDWLLERERVSLLPEAQASELSVRPVDMTEATNMRSPCVENA